MLFFLVSVTGVMTDRSRLRQVHKPDRVRRTPTFMSVCLSCGQGDGAGLSSRWMACLAAETELRSCVKVEMVVLGSPSLIVPTVSVDVKQL